MNDALQNSADSSLAHGEVTERIRRFVADGMPHTIATLSELVRIPSVSWPAFDPSHVHASANRVAELVRGLELFDSVDVLNATTPSGEDGHPAVLAHRAAKKGKPTVLLYAHHDVQPPGADELWESPPFEPTLRGERIFGRGASDDKAGVVSHIAALEALSEVLGDSLDLGVTVFIEGEEEYGSRSFENFLRNNTAVLDADVIIVADSDNWDTETPAVTVSLRGNSTFTLTVSTLEHASHSGMFGGAAPDAMLASIRLLNSLWAADGSVAVAGLTSHDCETPEFTEEQLRTDAALLPGVQPIGRGSILSRLWFQPAITVTGINAPDLGNASNTLIPSVSVRISARIAPGQSALAAFEAIRTHLQAHAPFGAHLRFDDVDAGEAFLVDGSGWALAEVKEAMHDGWGVPPVETGIGGSIPFIATLAETFPSAQILVTGVEDPDTRAHSPNESQHIGVLRKAIVSEAIFLAKLNERSQ